jgi:hypothetical protein
VVLIALVAAAVGALTGGGEREARDGVGTGLDQGIDEGFEEGTEQGGGRGADGRAGNEADPAMGGGDGAAASGNGGTAAWAARGADFDSALAGLDALPAPITAAERDAAPSYEREAFLPGGWADLDHDGCYTRNEILARDLEDVVFIEDGEDCKVASGRLEDPYTGVIIDFDRAVSTQTVQVDHIVPLAEAWRAGAWAWTKDQRKAFANDPAEVLAVSGAANQSKGDKGPAEWLPDLGRCGYGAAYASLAARYQLGIPAADRDALRALLSTCG